MTDGREDILKTFVLARDVHPDVPDGRTSAGTQQAGNIRLKLQPQTQRNHL